jgi:hypothetical protein
VRIFAKGGPSRGAVQAAWPLAALCAVTMFASPLAAQEVNISGLSDVNFGTLRPVGEARRAQSLCVFSNLPTRGYMVAAQGSGAGGAFVLDAGSAGELPFSVEWSDQPGVESGTALTPGQPLGGQTSTATDATCGSGPARSASLVIVLRATDLASARAAAFSGTLTLTIAPQ